MTEKLFVYGTLGPNRPNAHILEDIGGSWEEGSVTGILKEEGWGAAMGYPAIILDSKGTEVRGFVFNSKYLSKHWKMLDDFEGNAYQRVITQVTLLDGTVTEAYLYTLR